MYYRECVSALCCSSAFTCHTTHYTTVTPHHTPHNLSHHHVPHPTIPQPHRTWSKSRPHHTTRHTTHKPTTPQSHHTTLTPDLGLTIPQYTSTPHHTPPRQAHITEHLTTAHRTYTTACAHHAGHHTSLQPSHVSLSNSTLQTHSSLNFTQAT